MRYDPTEGKAVSYNSILAETEKALELERARARLLAALSDNPPDFASVHVLAGDLRKVLGL